ncbi:RDD family protein [Sphingobacterium sp. LRF_L2]|uniref:RDD family protein n=1 Tax=Sphingobacterium sp. LRF_L2 TaxID=3369421 RepID=UPI003F63D098
MKKRRSISLISIVHKNKNEEILLEIEYPEVYLRVKAMVIDNVILFLSVFILSSIFSFYENIPDWTRLTSLCFIILLYQPIFTSIWGATIGHQIVGICVKSAKNYDQNIGFMAAVTRYFVKASLGWLSLVTISNQGKRQAIHDQLVNAIVLYIKK